MFKVRFKLRGKINFEEPTGHHVRDVVSATNPLVSPDLKGIAETLWAEPVSTDGTYVIVKLLNAPIFQLDPKTNKRLEHGDICRFELKLDSFPEFVELIELSN